MKASHLLTDETLLFLTYWSHFFFLYIDGISSVAPRVMQSLHEKDLALI